MNPQGPGGNPDPQAAADAIREAFGRMAMTDEETAALIAGGHTFGKAHGAAPAAGNVGVEPEGGAIEAQGFGWENTYGEGHGKDTITSGLEGAWTSSPARWTNNFLQNLYRFEWVQTTSPGGAIQWIPEGGAGANLVPDAHDRVPPPRPDHAHHRPRAEGGPDLSRIDVALARKPRRVRGRLRPRLVQAHPPRPGTCLPIPRRPCAGPGLHLAGPGARGGTTP